MDVKVVEESSLEEVLGDTPPEKLDQPCRDEHLCEVAGHITDWPALAPLMGIKAPEMEEIRGKWLFSMGGQRIELLRKWKDKHGRKGTYRRLCKAFCKAKQTTLAEKVCDVCSQDPSSESSSDENEEELISCKKVKTSPPSDVGESLLCRDTNPSLPVVRVNPDRLDSLADYLRMTYGSRTPSFTVFQWPPPPTLKVFNLAMILSHEVVRRKPPDEALVRLTMRGNIDDIMERKTSIKLEDLFECYHVSRKRKIILIEGAPGAGKSTLAWDICKKWEARELFHEEFKVVVYVQLRDLEVQLANEIADLLPFKLQSKQRDAADSIEECHGEGVLFVLDGWDEYSPGLQRDSLFEKLICRPERLSVQLSTVLITSRPIASGKLQPYATSRVEIVGFTPDEVCRYFNDVFKDPLTVQKLYDQLKDRPTIKASCYLPLNAAIVAHLFIELNHILPTTLHGVFTSLVLSCIIRHMTKESGTQPEITSLDDLPPDEKGVVQKVCVLAYEGAMRNKVIFSSQDLRSYGLPEDLNALSLMQVVQSFATGKPTSYHFLHLSIQELLAAVHITKLPAPEQVQIFDELFGQPRFEAIFQFYAAFTKLQVDGVKDIVTRIVHSGKRALLKVMHCLYEAQEASLCQFVSSQLNATIDLSGTTLSPLDHLSLKYFLSCATSTSPEPTGGSDVPSGYVALDLSLSASLTPEEIQFLSLCNLVKIDLSGNSISCTSTAHLLTNNPQLKELRLVRCVLTFDRAEVLEAALRRHRSLQDLDVSGAVVPFELIDDSMSQEYQLHVFLHDILKGIHNHHSLRHLNFFEHTLNMKEVAAMLEANTFLQELGVGWFELRDDDLMTLANSLWKNWTLQTLKVMYSMVIDNGLITEGGVRRLMRHLHICHLKRIITNIPVMRVLSQHSDQMNQVRKVLGLPPLTIELLSS